MVPPPARIELSYQIEEDPGRWLLEEETMPETPLHDLALDVLKDVLSVWLERTGRDGRIARNLACRWDPTDARVGTDPDLVVLEPAPPEGEQLTSLRIWEPGHVPPRIAVEVVNASDPEKDYLDAPARCARLGVRELWVFDPLLLGPSSTGGPYRLQIWRPNRAGVPALTLERVHAGPGSAYSEELKAWLVITQGGRRLRVADDPAGTALWPTASEREKARAEAEKARAEAEKTRADELEAELARIRASVPDAQE